MNITPNTLVPLLLLGSLFPLHIYCFFNVILCPMLILLSIISNALCRVIFNSLFAVNAIFVHCQLYQWNFMWEENSIYFTNLVLYNPFTFILMTRDNLLCTVVTCRFILPIVCLCFSTSYVEFSSSCSLFISQFEFLMQWCFLFFDIAMRFISMFDFFFNFNGYFPCCRKAKSYHLGLWF